MVPLASSVGAINRDVDVDSDSRECSRRRHWGGCVQSEWTLTPHLSPLSLGRVETAGNIFSSGLGNGSSHINHGLFFHAGVRFYTFEIFLSDPFGQDFDDLFR